MASIQRRLKPGLSHDVNVRLSHGSNAGRWWRAAAVPRRQAKHAATEWAGGYSPSASGMISQNSSKSLSACGCGPLLTTISLLISSSPSKVTWNTM